MSAQIGGMALRDGVMLQGERFWAAAIRSHDGGIRVASGAKAQVPGRAGLLRIPVLRGLVRLGESMAVLPALRRQAGAPVLPQEDPGLLAATVAGAAGTVALRSMKRGSPLLKELGVAGMSLAPLLLMMRDSRLARYHGAEHKSVHAYESGGESAAEHKEHERCGSNLIAPLLATSVGTSLLLHATGRQRQPLATLVADLVAIGTAMELFSWMARHEGNPLARTLQRPGIEMQRLFTTGEPTREQLDVAHVALQELLRLEGQEGEPAARPADV